MVRCGLISDIHYGFNSRTPQSLSEYFKVYVQKEKVDVWIVAGDLGTSEQKQVYNCLKFLRTHLPNPIPILLVYGNHDLWNPVRDYKYGRLSYAEINRLHREWEAEFNIHYLPDNPFVLDDVIFLGFDGWYRYSNPPTNDLKNFSFSYIESAPAMQYLSDKAHRDLDRLLQVPTDQYRAVVGATHFPTFYNADKYESLCGNINFLPHMIEKCDVWCFGHSHRQEIRQVHGTLLLNSGCGYHVKFLRGTEDSDNPTIEEIYNAPRHIVFDV